MRSDLAVPVERPTGVRSIPPNAAGVAWDRLVADTNHYARLAHRLANEWDGGDLGTRAVARGVQDVWHALAGLYVAWADVRREPDAGEGERWAREGI